MKSCDILSSARTTTNEALLAIVPTSCDQLRGCKTGVFFDQKALHVDRSGAFAYELVSAVRSPLVDEFRMMADEDDLRAGGIRFVG